MFILFQPVCTAGCSTSRQPLTLQLHQSSKEEEKGENRKWEGSEKKLHFWTSAWECLIRELLFHLKISNHAKRRHSQAWLKGQKCDWLHQSDTWKGHALQCKCEQSFQGNIARLVIKARQLRWRKQNAFIYMWWVTAFIPIVGALQVNLGKVRSFLLRQTAAPTDLVQR